MNDVDMSKQVQQKWSRFIRQEAEEKANEIAVSAEEVWFLLLLFIFICFFVALAKMIGGYVKIHL